MLYLFIGRRGLQPKAMPPSQGDLTVLISDQPLGGRKERGAPE